MVSQLCLVCPQYSLVVDEDIKKLNKQNGQCAQCTSFLKFNTVEPGLQTTKATIFQIFQKRLDF